MATKKRTRKKARTPAQKAATRKMLAANKKRRAKKAPAKRKSARKANPKHYAQYMIATGVNGTIRYFDGVRFGPRNRGAHFMDTNIARDVAKKLGRRCVIAPVSTTEKSIKALLLGK